MYQISLEGQPFLRKMYILEARQYADVCVCTCTHSYSTCSQPCPHLSLGTWPNGWLELQSDWLPVALYPWRLASHLALERVPHCPAGSTHSALRVLVNSLGGKLSDASPKHTHAPLLRIVGWGTLSLLQYRALLLSCWNCKSV